VAHRRQALEQRKQAQEQAAQELAERPNMKRMRGEQFFECFETEEEMTADETQTSASVPASSAVPQAPSSAKSVGDLPLSQQRAAAQRQEKKEEERKKRCLKSKVGLSAKKKAELRSRGKKATIGAASSASGAASSSSGARAAATITGAAAATAATVAPAPRRRSLTELRGAFQRVAAKVKQDTPAFKAKQVKQSKLKQAIKQRIDQKKRAAGMQRDAGRMEARRARLDAIASFTSDSIANNPHVVASATLPLSRSEGLQAAHDHSNRSRDACWEGGNGSYKMK
jgi:hypothetical protein